MGTFLKDFGYSVAVDIVATIFLIVIFSLIGIIVIKAETYQKYRFFGLDKKNNKVTIYLSSVPLKSGTTKFPINLINSKEEIATPFFEQQCAEKLRKHIFDQPIENIPILMSAFNAIPLLKKAEVEIVPSHVGHNNLAEGCIIAIGSNIFNNITGDMEKLHDSSGFCFQPLKSEEKSEDSDCPPPLGFVHKKENNDPIPPQQNKDFAIIEKIDDQGRFIFLLQGTTINGTLAAINYLIGNWKDHASPFYIEETVHEFSELRLCQDKVITDVNIDSQHLDAYTLIAIHHEHVKQEASDEGEGSTHQE